MESKRKNLSQTETTKFIGIWREFVQDLRSKKRNYPVYLELQKRLLEEEGVSMSHSEIKNKICNLTQRYRLEKRKIGSSGGSPSAWEYYKEVDAAIGRFVSNSPSCRVKSTLQDDEVPAGPTLNIPASSSESSPIASLPSPIASLPSPNAPLPSPNAPLPSPNAPLPSTSAASPSPNAPSPSPNAPSSVKKNTEKMLKIMQDEFELLESDSKTYKETSSKQIDISNKLVSLLEKNNTLIEKLINKIN